MSNSIASGVAYNDPEFSTVYATAEIGYSALAQTAVTQLTSKSTGVTANTSAGQITMNAASLAATTNVTFTLTNSLLSAKDVIIVNVASANATAGPAARAAVRHTKSTSANPASDPMTRSPCTPTPIRAGTAISK